MHHPLITDAMGDKLSKKQHAPAVRDLRVMGKHPADVLGQAAYQVGLTEADRGLDVDDMSS